jgi:hypothetical protein
MLFILEVCHADDRIQGRIVVLPLSYIPAFSFLWQGLTTQLRLALNSWSWCFYLPSAGIAGMYHHAWSHGKIVQVDKFYIYSHPCNHYPDSHNFRKFLHVPFQSVSSREVAIVLTYHLLLKFFWIFKNFN